MRHAIGVIALVVVGAAGRAYQIPEPHRQHVSTDVAVKLARTYLDEWEQALASIVAEEHYTQALDEWPEGRSRLGHFIESRSPRQSTRRLVSDVLFVRAWHDSEWLMFRDVLMVDAKSVRDRQRRFDALFVRPDADVIANARRIADESARYNLGQLTRNVNTPVTALIFLRSRFAESTRFSAKAGEVNGTPAWELSFEQNASPFAIHTPEGQPRPASGRIWITPGAGRILKTEVTMTGTIATLRARGLVPLRTRAQVVSKYGAVAGLDVWVPLRMDEDYGVSGAVDETLRAEAIYTNHRQFRTSVRIVPNQ